MGKSPYNGTVWSRVVKPASGRAAGMGRRRERGCGGTKSIDSGLAVESKGRARFENKETQDQMTTEDQLAETGRAKGGKSLHLFAPAVLQRVSRVVDGGSWSQAVSRVERGRSSRRAALVSKSGRRWVLRQLSDWWWPTLPLTKVAAIRRSLDLDPGPWTPAGQPFESVCPPTLVLWRNAVFLLTMPALALALSPGPFWLGVYQCTRT